MTQNELIRRLYRLGRIRGIEVRFEERRGKSSHGTLLYGRFKTVLKDRKKEIGPGQLHAM
jgi:mRNA interferase HicA